MRQVKFYLEDEYYEILKRKAEEQGVSISSLVREMVLKEIGKLSENSYEKRLEELEKELNELKEKCSKMSNILKSHKKAIEELQRCCSRNTLFFGLR